MTRAEVMTGKFKRPLPPASGSPPSFGVTKGAVPTVGCRLPKQVDADLRGGPAPDLLVIVPLAKIELCVMRLPSSRR